MLIVDSASNFVCEIDRVTANNLAVALTERLRRNRELGVRAPDAVADIREALVAYVSRSEAVTAVHGGSDVDDPGEHVDPAPVPPMLLTRDATAAMLGMSVSTFRRRVAGSGLHAVDVGGRRMYRRCDVLAYVEQLAATDEEAS
jgi:hypothetical protein